MATTVYEIVELVLLDGTVVQAKPLSIKRLREFMKEFERMEAEEVRADNDKMMDVLVDCVKVAFRQYLPDYPQDSIEDAVDMPTLYKLVEVASGIKMAGDGQGNG